MLFNSIDFAIFLPIAFSLYWLLQKSGNKLQNAFIVVASYYFYSCWDWRFLSLIIFSTIVDYSVGLALSREKKKLERQLLLWTSITVNLGFLGFFKYYNFFLDNFIESFKFFDQQISGNTLNIILPVGISFYTFQTLSYTIDVYKRKIEPTRDFIAFSAFVSFFPQLVAGPIERASNLLPQFFTPRRFDYSQAVNGLRQILWGLLKKMVIADNCAEYANLIFNNSAQYSGSTLALGALFFTFQIYGDFSGYSDIAIGTARLFGFNLKQNFAFPYFSRDMAEFWRRWHISLSTWFRDYLYIPLGGSRGTILNQIKNVFIIFIFSGLWHGANWTFIVWGAINALYFLPLLLLKRNKVNTNIIAQNSLLPNFKELIGMLLTFSLTVIAWVVFRADSLAHACDYLSGIFSMSLISVPDFPDRIHAFSTLLLVLFLLIIEWIGRRGQYGLERIDFIKSKPLRWCFYLILVFVIYWFKGSTQEFIYFQF
ncbi:MBOAT family O-acyltransferase [Carboxylicivirga sp. N1Y90]|uniref:MBOAT family O-acyltransferase n=1 Tax=Carboxylicivirga fragile TaxID=3417571 RepID=UPI003D331BAE|nr:MBOAT family protein [Marinilabiliaceae bacterium N1Y90]